jgi:hypothetical protein
MNLTNEKLPEDNIYGELNRLVDNDVIDFDVVKGTEPLFEADHYGLKLIAKEILEKKGFVVHAPKTEIFGLYDVIAEKGDHKINVEVGITPIRRIWANLNNFNEVWEIPYDFGKPYTVFMYKRGKNYWRYRDFIEGNTDIMIKCPRCGAPTFLTANFCGQCGESLEACLKKYCKTCGRLLP